MSSESKNIPNVWPDHSTYAIRWLNRYPEWSCALHADLSLPEATEKELNSYFPDNWLELDENNLKKQLRLLRQRIMLEIARRDLTGAATLSDVTESVSRLADFCTSRATQWAHHQLAKRYGQPANHDQLIVVGMGKLGGRELNVSSDIDLVFVYAQDGETSGGPTGKTLSHAEFFTQTGRKVMGILSDLTEDGFVFRVDMRLRPNGDSGPLAASLDMLEEYFFVQGREWERYAWIKGRVVNTPLISAENAPENVPENAPEALAAFEQNLSLLKGIVRPFVYRKYLDFGVIRALRSLHQQIKQEVQKRETQQEAGSVHVKLGRGGIREIEFIAQVFQLIRGGRDAELRTRATLKVLRLAAQRGLLPQETCEQLTKAYEFWRTLEHRLQYVDDAQTHWLSADPQVRLKMAHSMGFEEVASFNEAIEHWQAYVSQQFDSVFGDKQDDEHSEISADDFDTQFSSLFADAGQAKRLWESLTQTNRFKSLPSSHQERLNRLLSALVRECGQVSEPDNTWARCCALLEAIARRGAYLSLLDEFPSARKRVTRILAASQWAADFLRKHPLLLDELLDERSLYAPPDWDAYESELRTALNNAWLSDKITPDIERRMDLSREIHHAQLFRLLAQDLEGMWSVERISDHISALADRTLKVVLEQAWLQVANRHRPDPQFAIIAYGKLGGKELGYASDLDLIFLYDDEDERAPELYSKLATRLNRWLTTQTPAGILFETDYRLRPNGDAGLIVSSIRQFQAYQRREGGTGAWVWEHQALTRARFCVGSAALGQRFEDERTQILCLPREWPVLKAEVIAMRQKMLDGHPNPTSLFDLKQDPGGMIDIEFIVQALVLAHSHDKPDLTRNSGNIALLKACGEFGLIPAELAKAVGNAYRAYRAEQHALRLSGIMNSRADPAAFNAQRETVKALWLHVFGQASERV